MTAPAHLAFAGALLVAALSLGFAAAAQMVFARDKDDERRAARQAYRRARRRLTGALCYAAAGFATASGAATTLGGDARAGSATLVLAAVSGALGFLLRRSS